MFLLDSAASRNRGQQISHFRTEHGGCGRRWPRRSGPRAPGPALPTTCGRTPPTPPDGPAGAVVLPVQVAAQAGHQQHGLPQRDVVQPGRLLGLRLAGQGEAHMAGVSSSMAISDRRGSTSRRTTSARSASSPRIAASRSRAVRRHGHPDLRCPRGRAGGVPRLEAPAVSGHQKVLAGTENPLVRHQYSASPKKMEKSMIVLSTLH